MKTVEKSPLRKKSKNNRAASPAISMVIITAAVVVSVLIVAPFAYQTLDRQQAASEFAAVSQSILSFDDAVRKVAWSAGSASSVQFTTSYGSLSLIPSNVTLNITAVNYPFNYTVTSGIIRYSLSTSYMTLGANYQSYLTGNQDLVVSSGNLNFTQAIIKQETSAISIYLKYRVYASREGPSVSVNSTMVNYVDILAIKLNSTRVTFNNSFGLVAKNGGIITFTSPAYNVSGSGCTISVASSDGTNSTAQLSLDPGLVVFNVFVGDVELS